MRAFWLVAVLPIAAVFLVLLLLFIAVRILVIPLQFIPGLRTIPNELDRRARSSRRTSTKVMAVENWKEEQARRERDR